MIAHFNRLPPVHGAAEEVSSAIVTPHHGAVDLLQGSRQSQTRQWLRVTRFQVVGIEYIVLATDEENYLLV